MREDGWLFRPIQVLVPFPLSERDGIVLDLLLGFAGCHRCALSDVTPVAADRAAHSVLASFLAYALHDESIVAVLPFAVLVLKQDNRDDLAALAFNDVFLF
jgi:hypothetical protein